MDRRVGSEIARGQKLQPKASIIDNSLKKAVNLPGPFIPTLPAVNGSGGVIKSFILDDKKTGVVRRAFSIRAAIALTVTADVCWIVRA